MSVFGKKMGFVLRNKELKTLHEAFNIARDIENNLKFGISKIFVFVVVSYQNTSNGEIPCEAEQIIPCPNMLSSVVPNGFAHICVSNLNESQESLLLMPVVSHGNDGMISGKFCDNANTEVDLYKGYVPFDLYASYVDYVATSYQVNHASLKDNDNENNYGNDHQSLYATHVFDVEVPNTKGSPNVVDYASENMQYDVNQILIKSDKTENEIVDDFDSVFNESILSDEYVSKLSGDDDYEDTEFYF